MPDVKLRKRAWTWFGVFVDSGKKLQRALLKPALKPPGFFESSEDAATEVVKEVKEGDLILIKGSRGVATDKVVTALRERFPLAGEDVKS